MVRELGRITSSLFVIELFLGAGGSAYADEKVRRRIGVLLCVTETIRIDDSLQWLPIDQDTLLFAF